MIYTMIWLVYFIQSFSEVFIKNSKKFLGLLFAIMLLLTALRNNIGTDYTNYLLLFNTLTDVHSGPDYEIGFKYLVVIFRAMGIPSVGLFFVLALIAFSFLKIGIQRNSDLPVFSLLLYFSLYMVPLNFNAMGQSMVVGIYIYSLEKIKNGETFKILFLTTFATMLHTTGIFILISYLIYRLSLTYKQLVLIFIFSIIILFISSEISVLLVKILPEFIASKFTSYLSLFNESVDFTSLLYRVVIVIIILVFGYRKLDVHNHSILKVYIFGFLLYALFSANSLFATRINLGFKVLEIILLANILYMTKNKGYRVVLFLIISLLTILVLASNFGNPNVYPYHHILE